MTPRQRERLPIFNPYTSLLKVWSCLLAVDLENALTLPRLGPMPENRLAIQARRTGISRLCRIQAVDLLLVRSSDRMEINCVVHDSVSREPGVVDR